MAAIEDTNENGYYIGSTISLFMKQSYQERIVWEELKLDRGTTRDRFFRRITGSFSPEFSHHNRHNFLLIFLPIIWLIKITADKS